MAVHLRIVRVPPGEAPFWVREKWVGLCLPLAQKDRAPLSSPTAGVLTGPTGLWSSLLGLFTGRFQKASGYMVEVKAAVDALAKNSPEAAAWWHQNTPHLIKPNRYFMFQEEVAVVEESEA